MTKIEFVAEEVAVELTETDSLELSLCELEMIGGGSSGLLLV